MTANHMRYVSVFQSFPKTDRTPWSRALLEKLIATQEGKKLPTFCGIQGLFLCSQSLPMDYIMSDTDPVHNPISYFFKTQS